MCTTPPLNPVSEDPRRLVPDSSYFAAAKVNQATASCEQSMEVTIITDQKDIVTLSFDADFNSSYSTYEGLAKSDSGYARIAGRQFSYDVSIEQSVKVDGDLNKEELHDIRKVMKRIGRMMKKFLSGNIGDVAEKAQKLLNNRDTLESVDAKLEFEKSVSVMSQTYAEAVNVSSSDSLPKIEPSMLKTPTSLMNDQPTELPVDFSRRFKPIDRLTDKMTDVVRESGYRPMRMFKEADRMFNRMFRDFARKGPLNADKMNVTRLIRSDFMKKLKDLASRHFSGCDA